MTQVTIETITPAMAADWLQRNTDNRPMRKDYVDLLTGAIRRGEWELNGASICFDVYGTLRDGQHRLTAILKAGRPVQSVVIRGLDVVAQETMDTGVKRTLADTLSRRAEKYPGSLAAILGWVWKYRNGRMSWAGGHAATPQTLLRLLEDEPAIRSAAAFANSRNGGVGAPTPKDLTGALWYLFGQGVDDDINAAFWAGLVTGADLPEGSPILALRRWAENAAKGHTKTSSPAYAAVTIKAWNAWLDGRAVKQLKWSPIEKFPTIAALVTS